MNRLDHPFTKPAPLSMQTRTVIAKNTAVNTENLIHSDHTAREYGFAGGLVAGSAVYGMLTHPLVAAYGESWLNQAHSEVRLLKPVYDQQSLSISARWEAEHGYIISAHNEQQELVALTSSTLLSEPLAVDQKADFVAAVPPAAAERDTLQWENLAEGQSLWKLVYQPTQDENADWCASIDDPLPIYQQNWLHPGLLLQLANTVFKHHYQLPPWIHTQSRIVHHHALTVTDSIQIKAQIDQLFVKKARGLVCLYVVMAQDSRICSEIWHTAIVKFF